MDRRGWDDIWGAGFSIKLVDVRYTDEHGGPYGMDGYCELNNQTITTRISLNEGFLGSYYDRSFKHIKSQAVSGYWILFMDTQDLKTIFDAIIPGVARYASKWEKEQSKIWDARPQIPPKITKENMTKIDAELKELFGEDRVS